MKIKSMKLRDFLSFEKVDLKLHNTHDEPPSIFLVVGKNYDQSEDSDESRNGAGKSSFLCENLSYNLFGKPLRGGKGKVKIDDLIRKGQDDMVNEISYFLEDGSELLISRSRNEKGINSVKVNHDKKDITKRTKRLSDKDIREFMNISFDVFAQCIVNYADTTGFMYLNYGNRLDLIKQIIEMEFLDELSIKAKTFAQVNERILKSLELKRNYVIEHLELIKKNKDIQIEFLQNKINELTGELNSVKEEGFKLPELKKFDNDINELESELKKIRKEKSDFESQEFHFQSLIKKHKKEKEELQKLSSSKCPKCFQLVDEKYVDQFSKSMDELIQEFSNSIETLQKSIQLVIKQEKETETKLSKIKKEKESVSRSHQILKTKYESLKKEITKWEKELKNTNSVGQTDNQSEYEKKLDGINKAISIRTNWRLPSNYFSDILNPKSTLRSALYKKYIVILSDMFEYYMNKVFNGQMIGTIDIDKDSNIDPVFLKDKQLIPYWLLSSGERRRVDMSLCLAFFEFVSHSSHNMPKYLVLDEPFSNLDMMGIKQCVAVLVDIHKRHNLDIFIVTHTTFPQEILDQSVNLKTIEIIKKNGISTVKLI
ncbi:MAG TPA: hypothetical protein PKG96_04430 [Bacilli bacterium]|nr:hypothetical protein [Bacilli bacterium]